METVSLCGECPVVTSGCPVVTSGCSVVTSGCSSGIPCSVSCWSAKVAPYVRRECVRRVSEERTFKDCQG